MHRDILGASCHFLNGRILCMLDYTISCPRIHCIKTNLCLTEYVAFSRSLVLPGYMDTADIIMHFSTEMWIHFRNVATNMSYKVCKHISVEKYITTS